MSDIIYASIRGEHQRLIFFAGCGGSASIGKRYQQNHQDDILVYALDGGLSREQNIHHHPVNLTKPVDKSTPLLALAADNNETMIVVLSHYRPDSAGHRER